MISNVIANLKDFGAAPESILLFNENHSESVNYVDFIGASYGECFPDGVIESNGKPLIYLLDSTRLSTKQVDKESQIRQARNALACRGESAVLAVIEPGQLLLYPNINPDYSRDPVTVNRQDSYSPFFIQDLLEGSAPETISKQLFSAVEAKKHSVHNLLFDLLKTVGQELNSTELLEGQHEAILALIGRALLTRFLADRKILSSETFEELFANYTPESSFSNAESASLINEWLDSTFNGDLLPLPSTNYIEWFSKFDRTVFSALSLILGHATSDGQLPLPGFINFAHVPVGLLSEVYERYAHENRDSSVRSAAKKESIHYTPRHIAELMLSQSFDGITTCDKEKVKVLDPSCGAGVFIVLAFRRLIAEHWKSTGIRPDTFKIREILYNQITGFDINKSALNLTALGLYLSALELDPEPLPTSKLKFEHNLIGKNLICVRKSDESWNEDSAVLGSLDESLTKAHENIYDLVIGNPPWTGFPAKMQKSLSKVIRDVAAQREPNLLVDIKNSHNNPDQVPDLPFVWKSMLWAKKGGIISFALHARLLFKNTQINIKSRNDLFKSLNITGILNASALRQTKVWPSVSAQFCLLFARNELPSTTDFFNFINPVYEPGLNDQQSNIRIDYQNAHPIHHTALHEYPYLLKSLFKGGALDVSIIRHIEELIDSNKAIRLKRYWEENVGPHKNGQGYQVSSKSKDATHLIEMGCLNLTKTDVTNYIVEPEPLKPFEIPKLGCPRNKNIYLPPLTLINEAIGADINTLTARVALSSQPIAFNESFYGYSSHGHPHAESLSKYLFLIFSSDLFLHYILMTSSKYGVEREATLKCDIDNFPFIPFELLSPNQIETVSLLFDEFAKTQSWKNTNNEFISALYGINKVEQSVIEDTLKTSLPIKSSKVFARSSTTDEALLFFCKKFAECLGIESSHVQPSYSASNSWKFIKVSSNHNSATNLGNKLQSALLHTIAKENGCSRIIEVVNGELHIGMLNQNRYWTQTRARLLAIEVINNHSEVISACH